MEHVLDFFSKGGFVVYPLLVCSIIGLAVVIEKAITLRRKKVIVPEIKNVIDNIKDPNDISLALAICEKHKGPFANIMRTGLENKHLSKEELKVVLTDQGRQEAHQLEKGLVILETIAGIAPLLGLLGTVVGILKVFNVISAVGVGQASAMAGGISEALITTIIGLAIGIPSVVVYNWFTSKADGLVLELEKQSILLINKVSNFTHQNPETGDAV